MLNHDVCNRTRHSSGVRPQDVFLCFLDIPKVSVSNRTWAPFSWMFRTRSTYFASTISMLLSAACPEIKKVSCKSRAGCCWGWNNESKFQKDDSTQRDLASLQIPFQSKSFGILHELLRAVKSTTIGGNPIECQFTGLTTSSTQDPSSNMALVKSAAAFFLVEENRAPRFNEYTVDSTSPTNFRFDNLLLPFLVRFWDFQQMTLTLLKFIWSPSPGALSSTTSFPSTTFSHPRSCTACDQFCQSLG